MSGLQFDDKAVDSSAAEKYLKHNEDGSVAAIVSFINSSIPNICNQMYDGKNLITRTAKVPPSIYYKNFRNQDTKRKRKALASLLKQNANLIAQLEYAVSDIPIEVTNTELNLIIQHLKLSSKTGTPIDFGVPVLPIKFDGPLLLLGHIIDVISCIEGDLVIRANKKTAVVTHLFVKLCYEAGWNSIFLEFIVDSDQPWGPEWDIKQDWHFGTVAIVSEDADVDSAVDTFISSPKQAPWYLRKILVQESVYQQFKAALSWKCNLKQEQQKRDIPNTLCSETLTFNDRTFLIDPVEVSTDKSVVTVEAYRTTKEMISLVQKDKTHFLSLWVNGIAEINEVTHSTRSPVVWVNNMADFRGPPQIAKAVYSNDKHLGGFKIKKCENISKLCKLSQSWLQLDVESRRDILQNALSKFTRTDKYMKLSNSLSSCTMECFADVGADYVCIGMSKPVGIKAIDLTVESVFSQRNLKSILYGNAFAMGHDLDDFKPEDRLDVFEQAGIPVVYVGKLVEGDFIINKCNLDTLHRAVWTNSGTIFAN